MTFDITNTNDNVLCAMTVTIDLNYLEKCGMRKEGFRPYKMNNL